MPINTQIKPSPIISLHTSSGTHSYCNVIMTTATRHLFYTVMAATAITWVSKWFT